MRRLTIILCTLILITSPLSACSDNNENTSPTTAITEIETQTETYIETNTETSTEAPTDNTEIIQETCNDNIVFAKPVIYLYPTKETKLSVTLGKPQNLTCTYPHYVSSWYVNAFPNGKLIDNKTGRELYCLYWEGIGENTPNFNEGFVVKGTDTIAFLEEKLALLGLSETEAEEFIIYWLPKLQENEYNLIRFATMDEINKEMPIEFSVQPDTLIRVIMQFKPLKHHINIKEQKLTPVTRNGFTVVEWGGCEIK